MKTRLFLLAGWMFIPILQLSAQLDTFDLSKYKLPDIKRRQLDLNFSSQLTQSRDNAAGSKNLNGAGSLVTALSTYTNSLKYQGSTDVQFQINPSLSGRTDLSTNTELNKSKALSTAFNFSSMNRFFLKDKFFLETDIAGGLSNSTNSDILRVSDGFGNFNRVDNDGANANYNLSASVFIGDGRIEPVQDARLAVYILQDLQKLNKLSRIPTEDEILEFSTLISQLKNKRYFDYRLHKIEELTEIDRFMHEKGLVKDNDIAYFTAVNDNWDYSSGPARLTGSKLYIGLVPNYFITSNVNHTYDYNSSMFQTGYSKVQNDHYQLNLVWVASYQWNKPIKLYWQIQYGADFYYISSNQKIIDRVFPDTTRGRSHLISPREYCSIGYFPNSRTSFSAGIAFYQSFNTDFNYQASDNSWQKGNQFNNYTANFNLSFNYYISPQLRLNGTWSLTSALVNDKTAVTKRNSFYQNVNLGLVYSIF